jgi:hypothetical protein
MLACQQFTEASPVHIHGLGDGHQLQARGGGRLYRVHRHDSTWGGFGELHGKFRGSVAEGAPRWHRWARTPTLMSVAPVLTTVAPAPVLGPQVDTPSRWEIQA